MILHIVKESSFSRVPRRRFGRPCNALRVADAMLDELWAGYRERRQPVCKERRPHLDRNRRRRPRGSAGVVHAAFTRRSCRDHAVNSAAVAASSCCRRTRIDRLHRSKGACRFRARKGAIWTGWRSRVGRTRWCERRRNALIERCTPSLVSHSARFTGPNGWGGATSCVPQCAALFLGRP